MDTLDVLEGARSLIEDPNHWTRGTEHRVVTEEVRTGVFIFHTTKRVTVHKYCMLGAVMTAAGAVYGDSYFPYTGTVSQVAFHQAMTQLQRAVQTKTNRFTGIPSFNDTRTGRHGHADVLEVFDMAIAAEKKRKVDQLHESIDKQKVANTIRTTEESDAAVPNNVLIRV